MYLLVYILGIVITFIVLLKINEDVEISNKEEEKEFYVTIFCLSLLSWFMLISLIISSDDY